MSGDRVRCPYCGEWVTLPRRRWPLGDPAARRHMKRCPFSPFDRPALPAPLPPSEDDDG